MQNCILIPLNYAMTLHIDGPYRRPKFKLGALASIVRKVRSTMQIEYQYSGKEDCPLEPLGKDHPAGLPPFTHYI